MDFSKLGQAAAETEDMTVEQKFERELPRAGVALLRFVSYIELGRQEPRKGSGYKPALKVLLEFELNHPDHMVEIDGNKVPQRISIRLNKGKTSKSGFRKLFNLMNKACGGTYTHFVQMLGKPFLGEIFHNSSEDGKKTYANLDDNGAYSLKAPVQIDALTNKQTPIPVAEVHGDLKAFLWENPSIEDEQIIEMWNSIYIEGTREVVDEATKEKTEKSKNWIQETIMANLDWEGSTTQALTQEHISIDEELVEETTSTPVTAEEDEVPNLD
jgi:hypothetical protein